MERAAPELTVVGEADGEAQSDVHPLRVGLTALDQVTVTSVADDLADQSVLDHVAGHATALAGSGANSARLRTIARVVALEKARMQFLQARQGALIEAGNCGGAERLDKLLHSSAKRLAMFLKLHREEIRGIPPSALVMVTGAEHIVLGEEQRDG